MYILHYPPPPKKKKSSSPAVLPIRVQYCLSSPKKVGLEQMDQRQLAEMGQTGFPNTAMNSNKTDCPSPADKD